MIMIYVFNGFIALYAAFLAITGDEILKAGNAVGTSSNQVLLGLLVVVLIIVVIYLGRKQDKANAAAMERQIKLDLKIDSERAAFSEERKNRIESLMKILSENSVALNRSSMSESAMSASVNSMSDAISRHSEVTKELYDFLKRQNGRQT
jgi:hypothetical protein